MVQTSNGLRQGSTLGQLLSDYLASAGAKLQPAEAAALRRFLIWCNLKTPAEQIRPQHIVEFFQSQNTSLPLQPRPYLALIKNFFAFAEAQGAVSQNPFLSFKFKGAAKGDKVVVKWTDNKGESRTDEATIA